jgi:uncharacterized protein DUF3592
MAEPIASRSKQQIKASALSGLFGLFAGLCAFFAVCATIVDWHSLSAQASWPVVSAVVERADMVTSARTREEGGGKVWKLRFSLRYEFDRETRTTVLTSRSVFSETKAADLQAWAAQHRKGSHIDIRVDPSRPNQAAFAASEMSEASDRIRNDLILLMLAAVASAALLGLSKYLRAREARAGTEDAGSVSQGPALGLIIAAMGAALTGAVVYTALQANPLTADHLMGVPAGLMFVFAGLLMALPPDDVRWRNLLATLVVTCFALTFDWVAFGPGERRFSGSIGGFGFIPSELTGRAAFGVFALILDAVAISMWIGQLRRGFGSSASAASPVSQAGDQAG